jgi:IclR family transcriptional regulator, acetate operon repressor
MGSAQMDRAVSSNGAEYKVPNLERGLSVIELLSEHPQGMIGSEIAVILKIPRNSAGRILAALTGRGFLQRDEKTRKYSLTQRLMLLGRSAVSEQSLIEESLDEMRALRDELGETVMLTSCTPTDGVVLEAVMALHHVRLSVDPGSRFLLHHTSAGKLYMADLGETERDQVLAALSLTRLTEKTITTLSALRVEIEEARERGYAVDNEEGLRGVCCVSASIRDRRDRHIAELTITGLRSSVNTDRFEEFAHIVMRYADNISRRLRR